MANTYLTSDNSRGNPVTASNPSFAHIRGWNAGVRVDASEDGKTFRVYSTGGSNNPYRMTFLGVVRERDDGTEEFLTRWDLREEEWLATFGDLDEDPQTL